MNNMPKKCIECGHIYFKLVDKRVGGRAEPVYGFAGPRIVCEAVCVKCGTTWRPF